MNEQIAKLLAALSFIVNDDGPWSEKAAAIRAAASTEDMTNIDEFCAWFWKE